MEQGLILDRYRPLADLRKGGHGAVVLAYDTRMARRVAIKRLPLPLDAAGRPAATRGLGEARTAALLNHPGIVTVHEWDTDADEAFLIMEFVDGLSLADLLDRTGGPLDIDEAAAVLEGVAAALGFAHDNGVLHLDLKPDNVLVTREGCIKVADFGVSALTGLGGEAAGLGGTLGYMPLEQLIGEPLDARADEWALAALTYEMLTGARPFDAAHVDDAIFRIEMMDVPPPSSFSKRLPVGIDEIVMTALSTRRAERYASAEGFAAALLPHLGDPREGRDSLARLVSALAEELEPEEVDERIGLWDRLTSSGHLVRRAGSAATAVWLGHVALSNLPVPAAAYWAATAAIGTVAWLAPGLGLALGLLALVAANGIHAGPWVAVLVFAVLTAYWWFMGRSGRGYAFAPLIAPFFTFVRGAFSLPMILGFAYPPGWAALSSALCAVTVMSTAGAYGGGPPFLSVPWQLFIRPWTAGPQSAEAAAVWSSVGAYCVVASWAAAGTVMSLAAGRGTRAAAYAGALAAMAWMVAGYLAWGVLDPRVTLFDPVILSQAAGSLILMSLVIAAGPPVRGETD